MAKGDYKTILPLAARHMRERALEAFQATVTEAGNRLVDRTPVDTGLLRGNWQLAINSADGDLQDRLDPDGSASKAVIAADAIHLKLGDIAVLVNPTPYAGFIEYGTSKIAPFGMIALTQPEVPDIYEREMQGALERNG